MLIYQIPVAEHYLSQLNHYKPAYNGKVDWQDSRYFSHEPSDYDTLDRALQSKPEHNDDIVSTFINDKLSLNKANINQLRGLIDDRTKIRDNNIYSLDYKIMQCRNYLLEMETWPILSNSMVEAKRANLGHTITRLESERGMEVSKCWNDQVRLYQELLKTEGEYKSQLRKTKLLSGENT